MKCANHDSDSDSINKSICDELEMQDLQEFALFQSFGDNNLFHFPYK